MSGCAGAKIRGKEMMKEVFEALTWTYLAAIRSAYCAMIAIVLFVLVFRTDIPVDMNALWIGSCIIAAGSISGRGCGASSRRRKD